ncbi:MAG: tyrosine-type recombinase/integrase [Treponema sp.]|nr:tyrosine-type recombinase/integrase [Treponema sp.]
MQKLPFSLTVRGESPYYYVRFRNERTGKFMSWISTKEKNYNRALRKAWDLYNQKASDLETLSFYDTIKKSEYTKDDVQRFLEDFQKKGFLTSFVLNDSSAQNVPALKWLCEFWNPETSDYLREKQRKGQTIHRKHRENSETFIHKYWTDILEGKKLGELTRADIQAQFNKLDQLPLNGNTKNHILRAVLTPLKWAYNNELIARDLSRGWIMYQCVYKKRTILTMEMARSVFRVHWDNNMARIASMLSMCTGMRCGEILALTADDLGENCIYVRHSYNLKDGLKCTKNGENRTVFVYFPYLMEQLRQLAEANPHKNGAGYIFWGLLPDKPIDCNVFRKFFRRALVLAGMEEAEAQKITFHAWRHFYTTYMAEKVNQKALQSQTGHKTLVMLEHYADHQTQEEAIKIMSAQAEVFGGLIQ